MREKQLVISKPIRGGKTLVYHQEPVTPDKKMTIKEKIMMFMSKAKPPVLINNFIDSDLNHCRSRRPVEKAFEELSKRGLIKREKCICNCSYLYKLP